MSLRAPKTQRHLEYARALVTGQAPPPPIAKLIGFTMREVDLGRAVVELPAGPQHANPMGTLHGGVIVDAADAAMGTALATTLEDDESFTTVDLHVRYFKPVWTARLVCAATVLKRTRNLCHVECDVLDGDALVARIISTCMILRGDDARGR